MKQIDRLVGLFAAAFLCIGLAMSAVAPVHSQINSPTGGDGSSLPPNEAPCLTFNVDQSTGTTEGIVATEIGYLSWVLLSTATADGTRYVVFKDTSVVGGSARDLMRVWHGSVTQPTKVTFQPPWIFLNGLTVELSNAVDWVTGCYRIYSQQVP